MDNSGAEYRGIRLGNSDRNRAIEVLGMHFADGRLDIDEFEERTAHAATATTFADLEPLFADLPGGTPTTEAAAGPTDSPGSGSYLGGAGASPSELAMQADLEQLRRKGKVVKTVDSVVWTLAFITFFVLMFTDATSMFWVALPVAGALSVGIRLVTGLDDDDEEAFDELEKAEQKERRKRLKLAVERRKELEG